MNIVEPNIEFIDTEGLKKIELIGKVCTQQESTIGDNTAAKFCTDRLKDGHLSIFEHEYIYYDVHNVEPEILNEFLKLSPYIRVSYNRQVIGLNYRTIIDIICHSRIMNNHINNIIYDDSVSDLYFAIFYLTGELYDLFYNSPHYATNDDKYVKVIKRLSCDCVQKIAPEILNVTYKITCDRGITHELVRHREFSFTQESTRYCCYSKSKFNHALKVIQPDMQDSSVQIWSDSIATSEAAYMDLIDNGETAQIARSVLPNATKSDIYMSGTLDMWIGDNTCLVTPNVTIKEHKGFLPLRTDKNAHPQMREIANMIEKDLYARFEDAITELKNK